jgi:hypothetical protein
MQAVKALENDQTPAVRTGERARTNNLAAGQATIVTVGRAGRHNPSNAQRSRLSWHWASALPRSGSSGRGDPPDRVARIRRSHRRRLN